MSIPPKSQCQWHPQLHCSCLLCKISPILSFTIFLGGAFRRVDYVADNQGFRASGDDVRRPIKRDADADPSVMMTAAVMTSGPVIDNRHGYLLNNLDIVQPSRSVMYMMDGDSGILLSSDRLVDMSR